MCDYSLMAVPNRLATKGDGFIMSLPEDTAELDKQLLCIIALTIDLPLQADKRRVRSTPLKHHIPLKTDHWEKQAPGFTDLDLVSHSGNSASREFLPNRRPATTSDSPNWSVPGRSPIRLSCRALLRSSSGASPKSPPRQKLI